MATLADLRTGEIKRILKIFEVSPKELLAATTKASVVDLAHANGIVDVPDVWTLERVKAKELSIAEAKAMVDGSTSRAMAEAEKYRQGLQSKYLAASQSVGAHSLAGVEMATGSESSPVNSTYSPDVGSYDGSPVSTVSQLHVREFDRPSRSSARSSHGASSSHGARERGTESSSHGASRSQGASRGVPDAAAAGSTAAVVARSSTSSSSLQQGATIKSQQGAVSKAHTPQRVSGRQQGGTRQSLPNSLAPEQLPAPAPSAAAATSSAARGAACSGDMSGGGGGVRHNARTANSSAVIVGPSASGRGASSDDAAIRGSGGAIAVVELHGAGAPSGAGVPSGAGASSGAGSLSETERDAFEQWLRNFGIEVVRCSALHPDTCGCPLWLPLFIDTSPPDAMGVPLLPKPGRLDSTRLSVAWLGLAWLGFAWLGLAWLGLAWLGLA